MNIDWVDKFVKLEKTRLDLERERLNSARSSLLRSPRKQVKYQIDANSSNNGNQKPNKDKTTYNDLSASSLLTVSAEKQQQQHEDENSNTFDLYTEYAQDNELNEAPFVPTLDLNFNDNEEHDSAFYDEATILPKKAKDLVNQQTSAKRKGKKQQEDDMEQWVSDTFYSYFPSYNNENQKRQNYLRERQQENQQNFLKHQQKEMLTTTTTTKAQKPHHTTKTSLTAQQQQQQQPQNLNTTRSSSTSTTDKTDLEIIVNNPNYVPPKLYSTRGGSTSRHKLLQDLRHTDLGGDGVFERNRRNDELISARKKDYQRELMLQIEEKRHTIERLRERERLQDEALTKRLEEQLRTIKLEEQLEKEKMRQDRLLFDSAQNRLLRDHLLAKLENDTKRLYKKQKAHILQPEAVANDDRNKVYKYFSNSARHEYRRGQPLPAEVEIDVEIPERLSAVQPISTEGERECYHLIERVCPVCDAPLRSFKSSCLRCQRKLSMKMKVSRKTDAQKQMTSNENTKAHGNGNNNEQASVNDKTTEQRQQLNAKDEKTTEKSELPATEEQSFDTDAEDVVVEEVRNVSLVCTNCEVVYAMCKDCLCKSDVCRACRRKRNVCLNCRRNLCSFCLQEIASGRDTERTHINEADNQSTHAAFQVLDVSYQTPEESDSYEPKSHTITEESASLPVQETEKSYGANLVDNHVLNNKVPQEKSASNEQLNMPAPYSLNIAKNSIFHADYIPKPNNLHEEQPAVAAALNLLPNLANDEAQANEVLRLERLHKETERRLSRYLKNYGDLMQRRAKSESRGTQTTPESTGRRDVVLREENNLSMPLLREMPKMTRQQTKSQPLLAHKSNIENLKRRWEVPAVQKFTISTKSPRVLTQIGAIRQQLQASSLFEDEPNE